MRQSFYCETLLRMNDEYFMVAHIWQTEINWVLGNNVNQNSEIYCIGKNTYTIAIIVNDI